MKRKYPGGIKMMVKKHLVRLPVKRIDGCDDDLVNGVYPLLLPHTLEIKHKPFVIVILLLTYPDPQSGY